MGECELLGGIFAYLIQGVLLFAALGSLVYKRHIEFPRRPWVVFSLDVGKQLVGGFFVHCANILVSELLESQGDDDNSDQCALYFINFFIDCTLGVAIVFGFHESMTRALRVKCGPRSAFASIGEYGDPPSFSVWAKQLGVYLVALLLNKLLVSAFIFVLLHPFTLLGNWLFGPLQPHPKAELVVVMVLCPWLLTTLQMWLFDRFLKSKRRTPLMRGSAIFREAPTGDPEGDYAALTKEDHEDEL